MGFVRKIGLTGGIASGKSRVAEVLSRMLDCACISADEVCRQILLPREKGWQEFTRVFGSEYLGNDGAIDRPLLRQKLFEDEKFRTQVDNILHPLVKRELLDKMEYVAGLDERSRIIAEVPLLYEIHWEGLFDAVVVVYADHKTCLRRLMDRDGMEEKVAVRELQSQWPLSEKVDRADYVIDNSGTFPETEKQLKHLVQLLENNGKGGEKKLDSEK